MKLIILDQLLFEYIVVLILFCSNFQGNVDSLEVGKEVEYLMRTASNGGLSSAELVRVIPKGSISISPATDQILEGIIVRPIRIFNPDQQAYSGKVFNHWFSYWFVQLFSFWFISKASSMLPTD